MFDFPNDENTSDILKHISKIIGDHQNVEDPPGKQTIDRVWLLDAFYFRL